MSTIQRVNFEPISDILQVHRRDFPLNDGTLADPSNAAALIDGEWVTLNTSRKLVRAADIAAPGNYSTKRSFPVFAEKGRYDVQAIADRKCPILWMGFYECDTRVYDAAAVVHSGLAISAVPDPMLMPLKVASITIGTKIYSGLVGHGGIGTDNDPIIGYLTALPTASNGYKLRFQMGF
jgi:hypothetical protein